MSSGTDAVADVTSEDVSDAEEPAAAAHVEVAVAQLFLSALFPVVVAKLAGRVKVEGSEGNVELEMLDRSVGQADEEINGGLVVDIDIAVVVLQGFFRRTPGSLPRFRRGIAKMPPGIFLEVSGKHCIANAGMGDESFFPNRIGQFSGKDRTFENRVSIAMMVVEIHRAGFDVGVGET